MLVLICSLRQYLSYTRHCALGTLGGKTNLENPQPSDEEEALLQLFSIRFWTWSVTGSVVCVEVNLQELCQADPKSH